jgi:tetratricopeptide (TPR) repeat protein
MFSFRWLARFFHSFDKGLREALRPVQQASRVVFVALWSWSRSRNWLFFAQALPALAMLIAVLALLTLRWRITAQDLESSYSESGKQAFKAKNYSLTVISYERLAAMEKDSPETLYEMAIALENLGDRERALKIMTQIAPQDQSGYGPAHLWMAKFTWKDLFNSDRSTRERAQLLVERHLDKALFPRIADEDVVNSLLGQLYLKTGDLPKAEKYLERATEKNPIFRLLYARVLAAQNHKEKTAKALEEAAKAANYFRDRATLDPNDKISRLDWSAAEVFQEHFETAIGILQDGYRLSLDPDYRTRIGGVYFVWQTVESQKKDPDVALQLNLLETGLKSDPTNAGLLNRFMGFVWSDDPKTAKESRAVLEKILAKGEATAASHFLIGIDSWQKDDQKAALFHWDRALELNPSLTTAANNLAWLLAYRADNPDFERALKLINFAIKKTPEELNFRDTRGKIFLKMEKWDEAASDLEAVLAINPNFPGIHGSLAKVYEAKGIPTIAQSHRDLQNELDRKLKKTRAK